MNWWGGWRRWWSRLSNLERFGVVLAALATVLVVSTVAVAGQDSTSRRAGDSAALSSAESSSVEPTRSAEGTTGYQAGYRVAASYPEEDCDYAADLMVNAAGGVESKADADFLRDYLQGCEAWHDDND